MKPQHIIRIAALSAAAAASIAAAGQKASLLSRVQRLSLPLEQARLAAYGSNPAQMFYRDSTGISRASADVAIRREQKPVMEQLGDGHTLAGIGAESYMRLTPSSTVWGGARFITGTYNNIRWTDCIDYLRVAPYVLGDEAGGDLSTRRYTFSGGYARNYGRWTFGLDAAYRAEIAYRNRDPRVKTIVSDLDLRAGGAFAIGSHAVGLSATLNIYNQSCDLDFYNPINDINTYTLTGLGTFYRRFMGNTNKNSGYSSLGYTFAAQWLPTGRTGLYAEAAFSGYRMGQQLRNFNNITLGYTDNSTVSATAAYSFSLGPRLLFRPQISGSAHSRKGTENLFGTSAGTSYDKIGSRSPYTATTVAAELSLPLQLSLGSAFLTLSPGVAFDSSSEKYNDPLRKLEASHTAPSLRADFVSGTCGRWLWSAGAAGSYALASSERPVLTGLDTATTLGQCVTANFAMLRADRLAIDASASLSRAFESFVLTLSASYNHTNYHGMGNCDTAVISLSAAF